MTCFLYVHAQIERREHNTHHAKNFSWHENSSAHAHERAISIHSAIRFIQFFSAVFPREPAPARNLPCPPPPELPTNTSTREQASSKVRRKIFHRRPVSNLNLPKCTPPPALAVATSLPKKKHAPTHRCMPFLRVLGFLFCSFCSRCFFSSSRCPRHTAQTIRPLRVRHAHKGTGSNHSSGTGKKQNACMAGSSGYPCQ